MPQALKFYNQALSLRREIGDRRGEANALNSIGAIYRVTGELPKTLKFYNAALPIIQSVGNR